MTVPHLLPRFFVSFVPFVVNTRSMRARSARTCELQWRAQRVRMQQTAPHHAGRAK